MTINKPDHVARENNSYYEFLCMAQGAEFNIECEFNAMLISDPDSYINSQFNKKNNN